MLCRLPSVSCLFLLVNTRLTPWASLAGHPRTPVLSLLCRNSASRGILGSELDNKNRGFLPPTRSQKTPVRPLLPQQRRRAGALPVLVSPWEIPNPIETPERESPALLVVWAYQQNQLIFGRGPFFFARKRENFFWVFFSPFGGVFVLLVFFLLFARQRDFFGS